MRLLHSTTWKFEEFLDSFIPPYAILSHRWSSDEVSYQQLQLAIKDNNIETSLIHGEGLYKIENCRKQAARDGIHWIWVDTCCINKESSAELSEAINSMFRWYQHAKICYIYLSDVDCGSFDAFKDDATTSNTHWKAILKDFRKSKWFTRGWTLQELLAPSKAVFYDKTWRLIARRGYLVETISEITGIDLVSLSGGKQKLLSACVAKKMSWIAHRETSRQEDIAYCMLGLLDVNMPLLYGEGSRAFMRLQLEVISKKNDESIFAWNLGKVPSFRHDRDPPRDDEGMLAPHPSCFAGSNRVEEAHALDRLPYAMTNQGLQFRIMTSPTDLALSDTTSEFNLTLNCSVLQSQPAVSYYMADEYQQEPIVITLQRVLGSSQRWRRRRCGFGEAKQPLRHGSGSDDQVLRVLYILQPGL